MSKQIKDSGVHWYAIQTYSGYEDAVSKAIKQRIETMNMQDYIFDTLVAKEPEIILKKGEKVEEHKKMFPGYLLVKMLVTDESWYVIRNTPNVTGFVGSGVIPVPLTEDEFVVLTNRIKKTDAKFKQLFEKGDIITITEGPFIDHEGVIKQVDDQKGKITAFVSLFGRETPVELMFHQAKKKA
jgi:transcription termination/antitermination protein NusG